MDATEIVRKFLSHGFQLDSNSLSFFLTSPEKIDLVLDKLKKETEKPTTITKKHIQKILPKAETEVVLEKEFSLPKKMFTVAETAALLQKQSEKVKKLLTNRVDLPNVVSINKISDKLKQFSLVAVVNEIEGNKVVLEDLTGKVQASIIREAEEEGKLLIENETAGFICENTERGIVIKKIVWPDIPFKKEVARSAEKNFVFFAPSDSKEAEAKIPISTPNLVKIFIGDENISVQKDSVKNRLPDPCVVDISGVKIFISKGERFERHREKLGPTAARVLLNLARKRIIFPSEIFNEQAFLEDVPDIFIVNSFGEPDSINYKGTSFLSIGDKKSKQAAWLVDLQSRENIKIDLA